MAVSEEIQEKVLEEAYSVTPNFSTDYSDKKLTEVGDAKAEALTENEQLYAGMINNTDQFYEAQIKASQDWAAKQTELQNKQTDFAIEQIEQQREQAHKDYLKEQSGAYVDWQKQSNKFGVEAERQASAGLTGTGFSESSQVSMYNTYQNRVATAREAFGRAVLNYDNAIKDAMLQNNAALAEIAYNALEKQLELSLQGFQYKNQLILDQANKKLEIDNMYWNRYQDVLDQINHENAVKMDIWKYQDTQKWQTEQNEIERQFQSEQARIDREFQAAQAEIERKFDADQAELNRKHDKEMFEAETQAEKERLEREHQLAMERLEQQKKNDLEVLAQEHENNKALITHEYSVKNQYSSGGSGGYSGSGGGGYSYSAPITGGSNYEVSTPYYRGDLNPDAKTFDTFENGYQPKGIGGYGKVTKTGDYYVVETEIRYGENAGHKIESTQNIWKTKDGTLWYWDGRKNRYMKVPNQNKKR